MADATVTIRGGAGNAVQIQGRAVDAAAPADTNVLAWSASDSEWEPTAAGGGGSSEWTDTGSVLHPAESTVDNVVVGGTTTANSDIVLGVDGHAVFNEQGSDVDFRIESDTNVNGFHFQGSDGALGLGKVPTQSLDIADGRVYCTRVTADTGGGAGSGTTGFYTCFDFDVSTTGTPTVNNLSSGMRFMVDGNCVARIGGQQGGAAGTYGNLLFKTANGGSSQTRLSIVDSGEVGINLEPTDTPPEKLSVDGAVALKSQASAASAATDYSKFYALGSYPSDYVGMWHFDGNLTNEGAAANAVSVNSAATSSAQKKFGTESLYLDASSSQYCTVASSSDWSWAAQFTVEAWVRFDAVDPGANQYVVNSATADTSFFRIEWRGVSNQWSVGIMNTVDLFTDSLLPDTWYHVALTRDGSNNVRFYRDGVLKGTLTGAVSGTVVNTGGLTIGAYSHLSTATEYFDGYIDEMRILKGTAAYTGTGSFTPRTTQFPEFSEMFVLDGSGNQTQISPHNKDTGEWQYFSKNSLTGKTVRINMEEVVRDLGELTGKDYIKDE